MGPMGSEECITEGITELSMMVQHGSYGLRGVHKIIRNKRTASRKAAEGRCGQSLWGSNLFWHSMSHMGSALCQWRLLPEGLHHGRLRNAHMASLLAGGREVLWGSNLCWHSMSHIGSALCQWRLLLGGLHHGRLCNTDVTSLME